MSSPRTGRSRVLVAAGIAVGVVLAIVYLRAIAPAMLNFYAAVFRPASVVTPVGTPVPDEGRAHVAEGTRIIYKSNPPASGTHYPSPMPWGVYNQPIAPGYFVHNLEHGGIVVLYDCPSGCPDTVKALQNAYQSFPKDRYDEVKLLVSPYSGLPTGTRIAALAWDYELFYPDQLDPQSLLAFYQSHLDDAPEDVP